MESDTNSASAYINDIEFQPPSPSDTPFQHFSHTPSYNGSYHSPYSGHSDLSFDVDNPDSFTFLTDDLSTVHHDYNPSDFDHPHSSSLLVFNEGEYMEDFTFDTHNPILARGSSVAPFDYSSPSSNGGADSGNEAQERRSRASSTSSTNNKNNVNHSSAPQITPSPRQVVHSLENMSFNSPLWTTDNLPSTSPHGLNTHKPPSPPRLQIAASSAPSSTINSAATGVNNFPQVLINAPEGDGAITGPSFQIVPATPVGGGDAGGPPGGAELFHRPTDVTSSQPSQQQHQQASGTDWPEDLSHYIHSHNTHGSTPDLRHHTPSPNLHQPHQQQQQQQQQQDHQQQSHSQGSPNSSPYLFPQPGPRSRSKSDTSLEPPAWDTFVSEQPSQSGASALEEGAMDVSLGYSHPQQQQQQQQQQGYQVNPAYNFPSSQGQIWGSNGNANSNNFLTPEVPSHLRRSKSDANGRPGHRQSRSEDIRSPSTGQSGNQTTFLFPPTAHTDFMNAMRANPSAQYLSADVPGRSFSGSPSHGHFRRASSGSRSERGTSAGRDHFGRHDGDLYSGVSSHRTSPYPSPHASPRGIPNNLPPAGDVFSVPSPMPPMGEQDTSISVSKPTVTTGRTANASHKRRKQEANFICPVPGCGSTFTRSFNLKGHIRSHNEEKPFQCHWPGCGKGFARQHDCKRHEQLHTNYRPFTCEGCSKQFARLDALNRHLRSEGGAECLRMQEAAGTLPPNFHNGGLPDGSGGGGSIGGGAYDRPPSTLPVPFTHRTKAEDGWGPNANMNGIGVTL